MRADSNSPIHRYFAGLAENTFQSQLGVVDPSLIDYLSDLLVRFVRSDVVHRIRSISGRPLMSIAEMSAEAKNRLGDARRELHCHIGDFALFWAGVYPEALRRRASESEGQFEDYCSHGKRSYHIASTIEAADEAAPPAVVLHRLSDDFELCAYGLREVRREWEDGDDGTFGPGAILLN
ncbi:hypothetical protein N9242_03125 [Vicingaceae bacterium]|nr:hypothetical protein [Vicingaceae bacterium]